MSEFTRTPPASNRSEIRLRERPLIRAAAWSTRSPSSPSGISQTLFILSAGRIRRRHSVLYARADKLFTRLRAARLDNTLEAELRRLTNIELLIIDDFALRPLDATQTNDLYELVVERHRKHPTIWVSNREPAEWLTMTTDALLAQSAVDRLTSNAHTLIVEGPSYRQRHQSRVLDLNPGEKT